MVPALIALGSNLGDRAATLRAALRGLQASPGIRRVTASPFLETAPVGGPQGQGAFLNAAALVETTLSPELLATLLTQLEQQSGRQRHARWGARTLDLDLLLFADQQIATPRLVVPHPRLVCRRFVLEPAAQIAGQLVHPGLRWSIAELNAHLGSAVPWVVLSLGPVTRTERLASQLAERLPIETIFRFAQAGEDSQEAAIRAPTKDSPPGLRGQASPAELEFPVRVRQRIEAVLRAGGGRIVVTDGGAWLETRGGTAAPELPAPLLVLSTGQPLGVACSDTPSGDFGLVPPASRAPAPIMWLNDDDEPTLLEEISAALLATGRLGG